jgi:hypothetical protein
MSITRELWISNLLDAASRIADKETQERRWLASDAYAWERPEELINVLFDDSCFDLFIEEFGGEFHRRSARQSRSTQEADGQLLRRNSRLARPRTSSG